MTHPNQHGERDLLIAYANLPFLNPARLRRLRESFSTFPRLDSVPAMTVAGLLRIGELDAMVVCNPLRVPQLAAKVAEQRERVITILDSQYPALLREIADPPVALFFRGEIAALATPMLAVVGTRRPTQYGLNAARALTRDVARAGLTIVSGLARGIDAAAHDEALRCGARTVAVLGTGIDIDYPREHRRLAERVAAEGCILTEFPPGTTPHAMNFPVRNRIISGLALGTLVVEAKERSGSLITARLANDQGREVFAVPGPLFSPPSAGPHRLIQTGAKLVHDAADIFEELALPLVVTEGETRENEPRLLRRLAFDEAIHVDQLAAAEGCAPSELATALLELELEGRVRALPGGRYIRRA